MLLISIAFFLLYKTLHGCANANIKFTGIQSKRLGTCLSQRKNAVSHHDNSINDTGTYHVLQLSYFWFIKYVVNAPFIYNTEVRASNEIQQKSI